MPPTWLALAALALVLAWPVPILLARATWPSRAPGTALFVWQAIALTGGLSMIGALLTYGLEPFTGNLVDGLLAFPGLLGGAALPSRANFGQMFAISGAILLGVHLLLNLATTFVRAERSRRRHLQLVSLLSAPMPEQPNARLIDSEAPVAYCLPGTTRSVTVLSAGLTALLDREQLRAVIVRTRVHTLRSVTTSFCSRSVPGAARSRGSRSRRARSTPSPSSSKCSPTTMPGGSCRTRRWCSRSRSWPRLPPPDRLSAHRRCRPR